LTWNEKNKKEWNKTRKASWSGRRDRNMIIYESETVTSGLDWRRAAGAFAVEEESGKRKKSKWAS